MPAKIVKILFSALKQGHDKGYTTFSLPSVERAERKGVWPLACPVVAHIGPLYILSVPDPLVFFEATFLGD